jgi:hypothetical protein
MITSAPDTAMKPFAFSSCILLLALTGCAVYPTYDDLGPYPAPAPAYGYAPSPVYVSPAPIYFGGIYYHRGGYYGGHRPHGRGHWH